MSGRRAAAARLPSGELHWSYRRRRACFVAMPMWCPLNGFVGNVVLKASEGLGRLFAGRRSVMHLAAACCCAALSPLLRGALKR